MRSGRLNCSLPDSRRASRTEGTDCPTDRTPTPSSPSEQAYVDAAYARLEAMRAAAERVRAAYSDVRAGGTHQARLERDIAWNVTQRRLSDLDIGDAPLDVRPPRHGGPARAGTSGGSRWRTRSTRRSSSTGARRCRSRSTGRPRSSRWPSCGAGTSSPARAASSSASTTRCSTRRHRRGRAADRRRRRAARRARTQPHRPHGRHRRHDPGRAGRSDPRRDRRRRSWSRAVRAPARPPSRCTAPRTSSTRSAGGSGAQGVLLVGPSPVFLRYIEHVLPSLGEQDVQLSTIVGLRPSVRVRGTDPDATAALKGDARMAQVIERAVADRERPLAQRLHAPARRAAAARAPRARRCALVEGVQRRRGTHNEQRPARRAALPRPARSRATRPRRSARTSARADDAPDAPNVTSMFDRDGTLDASVAGALVRGEAPPEGWEQELRARLRAPARGAGGARPHVAGRSRAPSSSTTCSASRALVRSAAEDVLTDDEQGRCTGAAARDVANVAVDRRRRRARSTRPTRCSARSRRPGPAGAGAPRAATRSSKRRHA